MISEAKTITFSQYYRTRAKECRARGNLLRDPVIRAEMFKLAIEYDFKAKEAEAADCVASGDTLAKLAAILELHQSSA